MTGGISSFEFAGKHAPSGVAGILYSNARMYDPKLGRFLQPDPIGYDDGPNMYAYVGADPVNFRDPTGLEARGFGESHTVTGSLGGFSVTPTSLMFGRLGAMRTAKINESDDIADRLSSRECETDTGETCSGPVDGFKPRDPLTSGPLYHSPSPAPPASDGRHRYRVRTVTLCNPREAFNRMRGPGLSAPGAPYAREGFRRGIVLTGNNPISQLVDSKAMTITNFTQEGHTFHKGAVHIQVSPGGGRTSVITVTGTGTGKNPVLNYILGMAFFAMTTDNVARSCTPGNDGLVP